jgi:putative ABC transport system permease protein
MTIWKLAWRLARGQTGRISLLIVCMALGISARVCLGSLSSALDRTLIAEARPLLGADIEISANQPLTSEQQALIATHLPSGAVSTNSVRFTTMAFAPSTNQAHTVEVRAVAPGYPLHGTVSTNGATLNDLQDSEPRIFVQPEFLNQFSVSIGASIRLGTQLFRIVGVVTQEPGMGMNPFVLGSRVLIAKRHLSATGLTGFGARTRYALLIACSESAVEPTVTRLRTALGLENNSSDQAGGLRVRSAAQASETVERAYDRVGDFLRIIALAAILLGGVGVASVVRGYISEQRDAIATLMRLGATPQRVARIFLWQCIALGASGGLIGSVIGVSLQFLILSFGHAWFSFPPVALIDYGVVIGGIGLGIAVAYAFGLIAVTELHGLQPAAIIRQSAQSFSQRARLWLTCGGVVVAAMFLAVYEARSWIIGPVIVGLLVLGAGVTALMGAHLLKLPALLMRGGRGEIFFGIRHGLRNLIRPGFRPLAAVVAIAAAAHLLATITIYRTSLSADLQGGNTQRPGVFCIDIQVDQLDDFRTFVQESYNTEPILSHVVRARLQAINGQELATVSGGTREDERQRFMRGRERRLSWRTELGPDEYVVEGAFMPENSERVEASLEQRFARDIGARMGDELTFDIQGVSLSATVTSIRQVTWVNLRPNFFILLSPSALRDAPGSWVGALAQLPQDQQRQVVTDITRKFPGITAFDVAEIGEKIQSMIERISYAVNGLGWFCFAAGILVLIGIGLGTGRARRQDAALLAVLGSGHRTLAASLAAEFGTQAALAGACGIGLGVLHAWVILHYVVHIAVTIPFVQLALLFVVLIIIGILAGYFSCRHVFQVRPLLILREE